MKNNKYILVLSLVLFFSLCFAVSAQNGQQNRGEEQRVMVQTSAEYRAQNVDELREAVQAKKAELEDTNQNTVRVTVHALLSSEDLIDGIGPRVSEIAREFNNSVQAAENAEKKISERGVLKKFFFGGDKEAAGELEGETVRNQNRVEELNQLINRCDECSEEAKNILKERIELMEREQERLANLANNEKGKRGLFGFLFGWMF